MFNKAYPEVDEYVYESLYKADNVLNKSTSCVLFYFL